MILEAGSRRSNSGPLDLILLSKSVLSSVCVAKLAEDDLSENGEVRNCVLQ